MNRATIDGTSLAGSTCWPCACAKSSAYATRSRCTAPGSSTVSFTGRSSGMAESFSFVMGGSTLVGCEDEVAIDDDADRKARPDGDGRLDVEIAPHDLLAGLVEAVGGAAPERCHDGAVVVGCSEFRADAEHGREGGRHGEPAPMLIDLIFKAGETLSVGAGLALQYDGAAARHDQPRPHQKDAILAEGDLAVIGADELRALRDQQELAARAVIDVLGHLCGDLAGKIGTNAGDEYGRNHSAGLDHVAGSRIFQAIGADRLAIDGAIEEGGLAILHVEKRLGIERRNIRLSGWCRDLLVRSGSRRRRGLLPRAGGGEQAAGARRFGFLRDALLFGVDGCRAGRLGAGYRPPDIARQGRAERGYS